MANLRSSVMESPRLGIEKRAEEGSTFYFSSPLDTTKLTCAILRLSFRQEQQMAHLTTTLDPEILKLIDQSKSREILQQQEADREAQLAKKPVLALFVGHARLDKPHGPLKPRQEADSSVTYDFVFQNVGDATANKIYFRALVPPDVFLMASAPNVPANDLPDRPVHAWVWFYPEALTPKGYVEITITFTFPKGYAPFQVAFNADSLEIRSETPLGLLTITPPTPSK